MEYNSEKQLPMNMDISPQELNDERIYYTD